MPSFFITALTSSWLTLLSRISQFCQERYWQSLPLPVQDPVPNHNVCCISLSCSAASFEMKHFFRCSLYYMTVTFFKTTHPPLFFLIRCFSEFIRTFLLFTFRLHILCMNPILLRYVLLRYPIRKFMFACLSLNGDVVLDPWIKAQSGFSTAELPCFPLHLIGSL